MVIFIIKIYGDSGYKIRDKEGIHFKFWRQYNHPKELYSDHFIKQKIEYIHNNPVEAGIVNKAEAYLYSSARDYYNGKHGGLLMVEFL
jgi:putative transposase